MASRVSLARPRSGRFLRSEALRPWSAARIWSSFFAVGFFSLRAGEQRADGETERCVWKEPPEARGKEAGLFQAGAAYAREFPAL